jgi:hypothetical protein
MEWKATAYVNLYKINNEVVTLRRCPHHKYFVSHQVLKKWIGCIKFNNGAREKLAWLTKAVDFLKQITGNQAGIDKGKRSKRGELNFQRESSKIFYGAMTEDATTSMKQQLYVAISCNEHYLKVGVHHIQLTNGSINESIRAVPRGHIPFPSEQGLG